MNHYEIETCVIGAKNGNKEDILKLLQQYRAFIFKTARQYTIKNIDIHDLEQIGYVAVMKALAKYKTGSCTFSSYVYNCIKNAFIYTARQNSRHDDELSLNLPIDPIGNNTTEFIDCINSLENLEEDILRTENISEIKKAVTKLPPHEMELIKAIYYSRMPLKAYADLKGIPYQKAVQKKNWILYKLSNALKN